MSVDSPRQDWTYWYNRCISAEVKLQDTKAKNKELEKQLETCRSEDHDIRQELSNMVTAREQGMAAIDRHRCALMKENKELLSVIRRCRQATNRPEIMEMCDEALKQEGGE